MCFAHGQYCIVFWNDIQLAGELEAVAALHHNMLTQVKFRFFHLDIVPAQTVADGGGILLQEGRTLQFSHLCLAFFADDIIFCQEQVAEFAQVGHGGGKTAAALQIEIFRLLTSFADQRVIWVCCGGNAGGVCADWLGDILLAEFAKAHTRYLCHQHLCQGKSVVAVDRVSTRICLEVAFCQVIVNLLVVLFIVLLADMGRGEVFPLSSRQTAGVVQTVAHGNLTIAWVEHGELRQIFADWTVQFHLALLHQLHHRNGAENFGDRAYIISMVESNRIFLLGTVVSQRICGNNLAVNHNCIGYRGILSVQIQRQDFRKSFGHIHLDLSPFFTSFIQNLSFQLCRLPQFLQAVNRF